MSTVSLPANQATFLKLNTQVLLSKSSLRLSSVRALRESFESKSLSNWAEAEDDQGAAISFRVRGRLNFDFEDQQTLALFSKYSAALDAHNFEELLAVVVLTPQDFCLHPDDCYDSLLATVDAAARGQGRKVYLVAEGVLTWVDSRHNGPAQEGQQRTVTAEELSNLMLKLSFERHLDFDFSESEHQTVELLASVFFAVLSHKYKFDNHGFPFEDVKRKDQSKARLLGIEAEKGLTLVS